MSERVSIVFEKQGHGIKVSLEADRDLHLLNKSQLTAVEAVGIRMYKEVGQLMNSLIGPVLTAMPGGKKNEPHQ